MSTKKPTRSDKNTRTPAFSQEEYEHALKKLKAEKIGVDKLYQIALDEKPVMVIHLPLDLLS